MKAHIFLLSFLITGQILAVNLSFYCPMDGPSGFWRNNEVAWGLQQQGWQEEDSWNFRGSHLWMKKKDYRSQPYATKSYKLSLAHGAGRLYTRGYGPLEDAVVAHRELLKGNFRHCIDQSTEVLDYEAKVALEKKKEGKETRLRSIEMALGEMKRVSDEINDSYKKLIELYTHPQINPEYKLAIEALNKRIQSLEEYKKTLEALNY